MQGPKSKDLLTILSGGVQVTEPMKNALNTLTFEGHEVKVAKTGYTGEPLGYEVYCRSEDAAWLWNRLVELGARPAGLGARDTLRMEAGFPLYGHEMGVDPDGQRMPIFAVPLAKFAVSFAPQKGEFIGRKALERQFDAFRRIMNRDFSDCAALPRRILPIALLDRGVMRAGMAVYRGEKQVGWVTSGTMVPYYIAEGEGLETVITEETAKRAIGPVLCRQRRSDGRRGGGGHPGPPAEGRDPGSPHERGGSALCPPFVVPAAGGRGVSARRPGRQGAGAAASGAG